MHRLMVPGSLCLFLLALSSGWVALGVVGRQEMQDRVETNLAPVAGRWLELPLTFVANRGQLPDSVQLASIQGRVTTVLERDRIALTLRGGSDEEPTEAEVALRFINVSPNVRLEPEQPSDAVYNFLLGNDESRWRTRVPGYASVRYRSILAVAALLKRAPPWWLCTQCFEH